MTTRETLIGMITTCRNDAIDLARTGDITVDEYRTVVAALNEARRALVPVAELVVA